MQDVIKFAKKERLFILADEVNASTFFYSFCTITDVYTSQDEVKCYIGLQTSSNTVAGTGKSKCLLQQAVLFVPTCQFKGESL
jgi:hypothetical protein